MRIFPILPALMMAATVPNARYDSAQTNANTQETILTPARIASGFGRLGSFAVDGLLFAQPLYIPAVSGKNLLIVATLANSVYAFNADRPSSAPIWHTSLGAVRTSYAGCCGGETFFYGAGLGIVSTPVADVANGILYVVNTNSAPTWVLSKLSLTTGAVIASTTISGQFPGAGDTGDTVTSGMLQFNPAMHLQRPALALSQGKVYIAFGGVGDNRPWHGWLFAYNADLSQAGAFCATPNSFGGAIWQSGGAPAIDASGNLYVTTGNDNGNADAGEHGESALKLSPTLVLLDWFTPANFAALDAIDADVSSNWPLLIPGTNLVLVAGKDFNVYALTTDCMGHLQGSTACVLQTWKSNPAGVASDLSGSYGVAFWNGKLYLPTTDGAIRGFQLSGGAFSTTPFAATTTAYGFPGPTLAISANGATNGILWATTAAGDSFTTPQSGTLRAYDALTLTEIWSGAYGTLAKYNPPTVANGRVYVPTQDNAVQVYGIIPAAVIQGQAVTGGKLTVR